MKQNEDRHFTKHEKREVTVLLPDIRDQRIYEKQVFCIRRKAPFPVFKAGLWSYGKSNTTFTDGFYPTLEFNL